MDAARAANTVRDGEVVRCSLWVDGLFVLDVAPSLPSHLIALSLAVEVETFLDCIPLRFWERPRPYRTLRAVVPHGCVSSLAAGKKSFPQAPCAKSEFTTAPSEMR